MARADVEALEAADARLREAYGALATLDPERDEATSPSALFAALAPRCVDDAMVEALARGLVALADATVEHFPENLLFDYDALAAALVHEAVDAAALSRAFDAVVTLHARFGVHGPIRFRYVHDFVYGFDWAKWVRRDPEHRVGVGPYDVAFLEALLARGEELLALIEADDTKYPRLRDERPRNPFAFSREPEAELRLHRRLAVEHLLPVEAWRLEPRPVWDRPFADLRAAEARVAQK
ncbi:MAG: ferrochelatase [Myxococcales bacterium]|nr:ferrochelatase [Myxococcales bacterium]